MANALFNSYKVRMLGGNTATLPDWDTDTAIKVALIDSADVTVNVATHDFYDDISAGVVGTPVALTSVTISSAGVVDAADTTFTSVSGDQSEQLVIYLDTAGAASTDPLLVFFDTFSSGMPITPNGGNIVISWHSSGIFGL